MSEPARGELSRLLFDDVAPPPEVARDAMFERTFAASDGDGADLLPPDDLFDPRFAAEPADDAILDDAPLDDAPLDDAPLDDAPLDDATFAADLDPDADLVPDESAWAADADHAAGSGGDVDAGVEQGLDPGLSGDPGTGW